MRDERGTETVEWAIIIGVIAVGAIAFAATIGGHVYNSFEGLATALNSTSTP
jgi:Flp pilus assembly pilin Flp